VKIHQTSSDQPKPVGYLYSAKAKEMLATIKLARLFCEDKERKKKTANLAQGLSRTKSRQSSYWSLAPAVWRKI